ncbi:DUF5719 family protein [Nocardiopsis rhodophaea]|uniref:DUF5719 family protein n=1 Tax=Nocardiopsis rhodophaea TaxID=280238 RepID=A0ABN2T4G2_9ACTN
MRLIVENRFALLGLVAVALAALFGVASATRSMGADTSSADPEPEVVPVESALRVCPTPQGKDRESEVSAFTPAGEATGGSLTAGPDIEGAPPLGETGETGRPWTQDVSDAERPTVVRADGALAAGAEVVQTTIGEDDPYATQVRCAEPGVSTWFAAPGENDLASLRVHVANVDDAAATVNVDVYTAEGPIVGEETRGVSVGAHGEATIDLTDLIDATDTAVVHVRTNVGRVAAALFAENTSSGADWVPPTTAPARRLVIPGVPDGGGQRRLILAAPGEDPVTADVRAYTPDGELDHEGFTELSIPPGASTPLSMADALGKQEATIVVEADAPVVAGLAMERSGGDDTAYAAAATPLEGRIHGRAVLPAAPKGTTTRLLLGAPDRPGTVVVTPVTDGGERGERQKVDVEAGHTTTADLDTPQGSHALVVEVAEDSGPVYAGRVLTQGSGKKRASTALPVLPSPTEVVLPPVQDTLTSVVP